MLDTDDIIDNSPLMTTNTSSKLPKQPILSKNKDQVEKDKKKLDKFQ